MAGNRVNPRISLGPGLWILTGLGFQAAYWPAVGDSMVKILVDITQTLGQYFRVPALSVVS